jgi:hypothetical protein
MRNIYLGKEVMEITLRLCRSATEGEREDEEELTDLDRLKHVLDEQGDAGDGREE